MLTPLLLLVGPIGSCQAPNAQADMRPSSDNAAAPVSIRIDAATGRHPISPLVYGVNFASPEQARLLRLSINRNGGNATTRYNWKQDATSSGNDWYFLSHPADEKAKTALPSASVDDWIQGNRSTGMGTQSMISIPLIGWVAKLNPDRSRLWSFSVKKYGPQQKAEPYNSDMGNGQKPDGTPITGNDPNDANMPATIDFQRDWVKYLVSRFGKASNGGVHYYLLDNEPALWNSTHRDVFPTGVKMEDLFARERDAAVMVKSVDPTALVAGPEEWGWTGYFNSGYDSQWAEKNGWGKPRPDRTAHGDKDISPWLLQQFALEEKRSGKRLLDVFTLHCYPQGEGVGSDRSDDATRALRERSTRELWDPTYSDESWIRQPVKLIPRMKEWVRDNYPGTKIGVTEYNWGAEKDISGAVAQADVLGIFGREGVDLATRWVCPGLDTPTFKAIQMYRNYDGKGSGFGNTSIACTVTDTATISAFASQDGAKGAIKIMLISKRLQGDTPIALNLAHIASSGNAAVYQLTSTNKIDSLPSIPVSGSAISLSLPAQSVTLFVLSPK